jgi:hypothetical protein
MKGAPKTEDQLDVSTVTQQITMENPARQRPFKKADTASGRLRPVSDPLESVGFPSKGDKT